MAEYAKSQGIDDEPAFKRWVPYTLRKRYNIIGAVKAMVWLATHKYGIEVPRSIEHSKQLDKKNGNTFFIQEIAKEMYNVAIFFELLEQVDKAPPGWKPSSGHIIFDVKMDFTRKARWVKDGHKTPDPWTSNYAGVISRDSVNIDITYSYLNDVDVTSADIQNAYLQEPYSEKHFIICGPEFWLEHVGKIAMIRQDLYGGKMAGRDFWIHISSCMNFLGFKSI